VTEVRAKEIVKAVKFYYNDKQLVTLEGDLLCGSILCGVLTGYEYNISLRFILI
jgi:hypothetical protein